MIASSDLGETKFASPPPRSPPPLPRFFCCNTNIPLSAVSAVASLNNYSFNASIPVEELAEVSMLITLITKELARAVHVSECCPFPCRLVVATRYGQSPSLCSGCDFRLGPTQRRLYDWCSEERITCARNFLLPFSPPSPPPPPPSHHHTHGFVVTPCNL